MASTGLILEDESMNKLKRLQLALIISVLALMPVFADGGDSSDPGSSLAPFQKLIEDQQFQKAISGLEAALADDPDDADLLNLIAYSHRKLERFETALDFYQKALTIEPKHRGANEYLGELYLQMGQPDKAEQRLKVLDKACFFGCEEYDELKQAIEAYRQNNPS